MVVTKWKTTDHKCGAMNQSLPQTTASVRLLAYSLSTAMLPYRFLTANPCHAVSCCRRLTWTRNVVAYKQSVKKIPIMRNLTNLLHKITFIYFYEIRAAKTIRILRLSESYIYLKLLCRFRDRIKRQ